MLPLSISKIGHLDNMAIPNQSAESRQISIIYQDDFTVISAPYELPLI